MFRIFSMRGIETDDMIKSQWPLLMVSLQFYYNKQEKYSGFDRITD